MQFLQDNGCFNEKNIGSQTRFWIQPTSLSDALQLKKKTIFFIGNSEVYNVVVERVQYISPEFVTKYKDTNFLSLNPIMKKIFIKA